MKNAILTGLKVREHHMQEMQAHVHQNLPEEACGLLAASAGTSQAVFPITNTLHSPVKFFMDPFELLQALQTLDERGWELHAVFHSHPVGPAVPSETDLREYLLPEVPALIWHRRHPDFEPASWSCSAFLIKPDGYQPLKLNVTAGTG